MTDRDTFRDGWGPGRFDADDWRAGDRDYSEDEPRGLIPEPLVAAGFWLAVGFATGIVGFVFGVMIVRAFL